MIHELDGVIADEAALVALGLHGLSGERRPRGPRLAVVLVEAEVQALLVNDGERLPLERTTCTCCRFLDDLGHW